MVKGLIALFVCVSVNLNVHATNFFLTGPKKVLVYCEYFDEGLLESELGLSDALSKKGFICKNLKNIEGTEMIFCADKDKNHLFAGFAKDETSCLNDFKKLMKSFEKFNQPLPKID
jgi:hypothetical protein